MIVGQASYLRAVDNVGISIVRRYTFDAAHSLDWHPGKCKALHGHGYVLEVELIGPLDERGVVADFEELDEQVERLALSRLDHQHLNKILANPTAERIALVIGEWLAEAGVRWSEIRLWETERGSVVLRRTP